MKKNFFKVSAVLLAATLLSTSCIGSFGLFNKYEQWQCSMTSSKIVNGIVGLILQPIVGGICLFVDAVVLNTIEFWTGNNPVAANVGKTVNVLGSDGNYYAVKTLEDGYEVTSPKGDMVRLSYNAKNNSWSISQNGETRELFRYNEDGTIKATLPTGEQMDVALNEYGVEQVKTAVGGAYYYALR